MIGTDEMSSTGMDITPDMSISLGVNENLHHSHQHQQHGHHYTQQQQQHPQAKLTLIQQHHLQNNTTHTHHGSQHQRHQHSSRTDRTMMNEHDAGIGGSGSVGAGGDSHNDASGLSDGSSASTTDPTLHEFWTSEKEHTSHIFEDLDRYCWQQQSSHSSTTNTSSNTVMHHSSIANTLHPLHTSSLNPSSPHNQHSPATPVNTTASLSSTSVQQNQLNSNGSISNIISSDGQIYTLTVLNGNEPWLKRETEAHLNSTLDLDSLLGTFPGYVKSEYPYDDSGFSTDGCKDITNDTANVINRRSSSGGSAVISQNNQRLPSFIHTISVNSSGTVGNVSNIANSVTSALNINHQLDQFHNNNNDWHMTDHNNEQNSAESLLRSALQGKGYAKGLHVHNCVTLMSNSPSVKDDDMRRIMFPVGTDGLNFSDTSLSTSQMFDDTESPNGDKAHILLPQSPVTNGPLTPITINSNANNNNNNQTTSLIVDDMFLSLENAFSDDFEKIKHFCSTVSNTNNYATNEVMMHISQNDTGTTQAANTNIRSIQSVTTTHQTMLTATLNNICGQSKSEGGIPTAMQQQHLPPQPLKPEVTTSTQCTVTANKATKKYKRTLTAAHHNNNHNLNVINNNNCTANTNLNLHKGFTNNMTVTNVKNFNGSNSSSGSSTNSSNSPTNFNSLVGSGGIVIGCKPTIAVAANNLSHSAASSSSSTTASAQRKERSLHYCSICSKGFKDKYSVNVHIRTHTGEKPFACTLCGKSFRQKAHLAKHYQTHMAQKNNGNLVKGNSNKHHRSLNAQNLNTSPISVNNHPRSLSVTNTPNTSSSITNKTVGGLVSEILSSNNVSSLGVSASTSSGPITPTTILPPANSIK